MNSSALRTTTFFAFLAFGLWQAPVLMGQAPAADPQVSDTEKANESGDEMKQPVELGRVRWQRDLAAAREQATKNGKPILLLFQEVPG